jgi:hypothetical protein
MKNTYKTLLAKISSCLRNFYLIGFVFLLFTIPGCLEMESVLSDMKYGDILPVVYPDYTETRPIENEPNENNQTTPSKSNQPTSKRVCGPINTKINIRLTNSNNDNNSTTYIVSTQPQHGTLSGKSPNLIYTPEENYVGPDSFTYKIDSDQIENNEASADVLVYSPSTSNGWPMRRADAQNSGRTSTIGPDDATIKLVTPKYGNFVVSDSYIYLGYMYQTCLDFDGQEKWSLSNPNSLISNNGRPIITNNGIIVESDFGGCDPETGNLLWSFSYTDLFARQIKTILVGSDGMLYTLHEDSGYSVPGQLRKFDSTDGSQKWMLSNYDSALAISIDGTTLYCSQNHNLLISLNSNDQVINWAREIGGIRSIVVSSHAIYVSFGSWGENISSFDPVTGKVNWSIKRKPWDGYENNSFLALGHDETLFVGGTTIAAVNPENGQYLWENDKVGGSIIVDGAETIFAKSGQTIYRLDGNTGDILWSMNCSSFDASGILEIAPNGTLLICCGTGLFAIGSEGISVPSTNDQTVTTSIEQKLEINLTVKNPDDDSISYSIASFPMHGTLEIKNLPQVIYVPAIGFTGTDTFIYQVSNGAYSSSSTVTINVVPVK